MRIIPRNRSSALLSRDEVVNCFRIFLLPVTLDLAINSQTRNTTIGIIATNAKLTQAQCTRLATAAHDGIGRAIVPAHTPVDGDLIFTASMGDVDCDDLLHLGHAAATCMARAIARAVYLARSTPFEDPPCYARTFS